MPEQVARRRIPRREPGQPNSALTALLSRIVCLFLTIRWWLRHWRAPFANAMGHTSGQARRTCTFAKAMAVRLFAPAAQKSAGRGRAQTLSPRRWSSILSPTVGSQIGPACHSGPLHLPATRFVLPLHVGRREYQPRFRPPAAPMDGVTYSRCDGVITARCTALGCPGCYQRPGVMVGG